MATKTKTREITITEDSGTFSTFFKRFTTDTKDYDFEGISALRKLLSNEKSKIIHTIKKRNPKSIYELAKMVDRDFKSVREDIKLLERFGFIDMIAESSGKRERLKPILVVDSIIINIKL